MRAFHRCSISHSLLLGLGVIVAGCGSPPSQPAAQPATSTAPSGSGDAARSDASALAFRNAVNDPPPGWSGPGFRLSHNDPAQKHADWSKKDCPWLAVSLPDGSSPFDVNLTGTPPDWKSGPWREYIQRVLTYVREGQDPQLANNP